MGGNMGGKRNKLMASVRFEKPGKERRRRGLSVVVVSWHNADGLMTRV